jgi:hypothetical protein
MGPDAGMPPAIHFTNVGQTSEDVSSSFDLIVTNMSAYDPYDSAQNRLVGGIAQISLRSPTSGSCENSVRLRLDFVHTHSGLPVDFPKPYKLNVIDLDEGAGGRECVDAEDFTKATTDTMNEDGSELISVVSATPPLYLGAMNGATDTTRFCATEGGSEADNPSDPGAMTTEQRERAVELTYEGPTVHMTLLLTTCGSAGQNFLLAGESNLIPICSSPPPPLPSMPPAPPPSPPPPSPLPSPPPPPPSPP